MWSNCCFFFQGKNMTKHNKTKNMWESAHVYLGFLLLFLKVTNGGWVFERHPAIPPKNTHRKTWTLFSATSAETPKDSKYIVYISKDLFPPWGYPTIKWYIQIYTCHPISVRVLVIQLRTVNMLMTEAILVPCAVLAVEASFPGAVCFTYLEQDSSGQSSLN